jgi:predicted helicase
MEEQQMATIGSFCLFDDGTYSTAYEHLKGRPPQFQDKYGFQVSTWNISHYIYSTLYHAQYQECYKRSSTTFYLIFPLLIKSKSFETCVYIGKQLMSIHLNYEQAKKYRLKWIENQDIPFSWRVEKMRLNLDRTAVIVNECCS